MRWIGGKSLEFATKNAFTKRGLLPDTEHSFRVRAVRGSSVSEWSDAVKGRTQKLLIPSNFSVQNVTWDTITLVWDAVEKALSYQVEVDGGKSLDN